MTALEALKIARETGYFIWKISLWLLLAISIVGILTTKQINFNSWLVYYTRPVAIGWIIFSIVLGISFIL